MRPNNFMPSYLTTFLDFLASLAVPLDFDFKMEIQNQKFWQRAFHGFGQDRFPDGGLVQAKPIFNTALAASKNTTSKVVKINPK